MAIPQRAVLDGPTGKYVYVAATTEQGRIALQKPVSLGSWVDIDTHRMNYWIVKSGLDTGDEVIVDGVARIFFPGMPVSPTVQATSPPASSKQADS
jgi:membrane fusion protein (multidrug efflux system)